MKRFHTVHEFAAAPAEVAAVMTDASFAESLELPDVGPIEVLDRTSDATGTLLRAQMRFTGSLDPIARRVLAGARISWVQEVRLDPNGEHGTLTVRPDTQPDRLRCEGTYELKADGPGTVRTLDGFLDVRVPLIGNRAEGHILPGLLRRLDLEAEALAAWLQTHR